MASQAIPVFNVGGNTNQPTEDPSKRAASSQVGLFKQLIDAIEGLGSDVVKAIGFDRPNQDRGSASATPDILKINAQNTPPAASDYWGPDNPEISFSHQNNQGPEFRFVGIQEWQPSAQGGNKKPSLFPGPAQLRHNPVFTERFARFSDLVGRSNVKLAGTFTQMGVSGQKILQDAGVNAEPSGVSGGSGSGSESSGSGSSGGGGIDTRPGISRAFSD